MIDFKCPHCAKAYKIKDEFAGRKATCQGCQKVFVIPAAPVAAPPKAASAPPPMPAVPAAAAPKPAAPVAPVVKVPAATKPIAPPPAAKPAPVSRPAAVAPPRPPAKPAANGNGVPAKAPPKPAAPLSEEEAEALAAAAFTEKPAEVEIQVQTTVDFRCPMCDEPIQVAIALAGKQAPCPECRRIVKVPVPRTKSNDWRKAEKKGPSGARLDVDEAPGDVWNSKASTVSVETLEQAGALREKKQPWTWGQRVKAAGLTLLVIGLLGGGWFLYRGYATHKVEDQALAKALRSFDPKAKLSPLPPLVAAEVQRGTGEFYARAGLADKAREHLQVARGNLVALPPSPARDAALIDLARTHALAVPDQAFMDKAVIKKEGQRSLERSLQELERTLQLFQDPIPRAEALRQVWQTLTARKRDNFLPDIAAQLGRDGQVEALAVIGLESLRAGRMPEATALADRALKAREAALANPTGGGVDGMGGPPSKTNPPPVGPFAPSLVTLCIALKKPQDVLDGLKPKGTDARQKLAYHLGQAEGSALDKNLEKAREMALGLADPLDEWKVRAVIAAVGLERDTLDKADLAAVFEPLDAEVPLRLVDDRPVGGKPTAPWLLWRLARAAGKAGQNELAARFAKHIPPVSSPEKTAVEPAALKGQIALELLRQRLASGKEKPADDWAKDVDPLSPAALLAKEALARHNARSGTLSLKAVDAWQPETDRPIGYVALALGVQDGER